MEHDERRTEIENRLKQAFEDGLHAEIAAEIARIRAAGEQRALTDFELMEEIEDRLRQKFDESFGARVDEELERRRE